jgi:hypothetical protein
MPWRQAVKFVTQKLLSNPQVQAQVKENVRQAAAAGNKLYYTAAAKLQALKPKPGAAGAKKSTASSSSSSSSSSSAGSGSSSSGSSGAGAGAADFNATAKQYYTKFTGKQFPSAAEFETWKNRVLGFLAVNFMGVMFAFQFAGSAWAGLKALYHQNQQVKQREHARQQPQTDAERSWASKVAKVALSVPRATIDGAALSYLTPAGRTIAEGPEWMLTDGFDPERVRGVGEEHVLPYDPLSRVSRWGALMPSASEVDRT